VSALFAAIVGGASALQKAGSVAAIVGASVAVVLLLAGIVAWLWRRHRVRSIKVRVFTEGVSGFLIGIEGFPLSTKEFTLLVSDGKTTRKIEGYVSSPSEQAFSLETTLTRQQRSTRLKLRRHW
jgi:hypothetical protein